MLLWSNHYYIKTTIYFFFKEKKSFVHSQSKHVYFLSKCVIQNCFVIKSCTWLYECDMIKSRNRLVEAAFIGQYSKHRICFFRSHQKIREITSFTYVRNSPFRRHWRESVHWLVIDFLSSQELQSLIKISGVALLYLDSNIPIIYSCSFWTSFTFFLFMIFN